MQLHITFLHLIRLDKNSGTVYMCDFMFICTLGAVYNRRYYYCFYIMLTRHGQTFYWKLFFFNVGRYNKMDVKIEINCYVKNHN